MPDKAKGGVGHRVALFVSDFLPFLIPEPPPPPTSYLSWRLVKGSIPCGRTISPSLG